MTFSSDTSSDPNGPQDSVADRCSLWPFTGHQKEDPNQRGNPSRPTDFASQWNSAEGWHRQWLAYWGWCLSVSDFAQSGRMICWKNCCNGRLTLLEWTSIGAYYVLRHTVRLFGWWWEEQFSCMVLFCSCGIWLGCAETCAASPTSGLAICTSTTPPLSL